MADLLLPGQCGHAGNVFVARGKSDKGGGATSWAPASAVCGGKVLAPGAGAAAGAVKPVEDPHVGVGELEVEHLRVGADPLPAAGLGDHDGPVLDRPPEHHL